jgi:hypothetical protein
MCYRAPAIGLDFLGASPFRRENPDYRLLDFLGFPWNLSSETRLINGLRGYNRKNIFAGLFPVASAQPGAALTSGARRYGSLIGQAYPDFRFPAINCPPKPPPSCWPQFKRYETRVSAGGSSRAAIDRELGSHHAAALARKLPSQSAAGRVSRRGSGRNNSALRRSPAPPESEGMARRHRSRTHSNRPF